jgi:enoyl-CoA hydratase/carnithine racemase
LTDDTDTVRYDVRDGLATITLARPDKRNALDASTFELLGDQAQMAADDDGVRAVLVVGEGRSFCAGIDLSAIPELARLATDEAGLRAFIHMAQRPYAILASMAKPTLAAVQGHALGAGFQLALACDLRLASDDATFGMLEARYGLIPDLGGMHRLTRLVGPARAKELVWSTRTIDAGEAERIGLVNAVVPADRLGAEAVALLTAVTSHGPLTTALAKSLIETATEIDLNDELRREEDAQVKAIQQLTFRPSTPNIGPP